MNTRAKFDVIIVGAGPAGSSAAHSLATKGFKVILLDRAIFPREKLCGGLLSARSEKIFTEIYQESWTPTIEIVAHGVEFFDKERRVNKVANYKPMYFTCRSKFDAYLLEMTASIISSAKTSRKTGDLRTPRLTNQLVTACHRVLRRAGWPELRSRPR